MHISKRKAEKNGKVDAEEWKSALMNDGKKKSEEKSPMKNLSLFLTPERINSHNTSFDSTITGHPPPY